MRWVKDEEFIRGSCPMTKFEVRVVIMGMLNVDANDILLDIGAGTGSISVEAALQGAKVIAVEGEEEGVQLIYQNAEKFGVDLQVIHGRAPEVLNDIASYNKCFIGGTGGNMNAIFDAVYRKIKCKGIIAANFVTLKNLHRFQNLLEEYGCNRIETRLLQVSVIDPKTGIFKANNPVFIVKGEKE